MRPDAIVSKWVVGIAFQQEVLEEAHVLKTKQGDLMLRLKTDSQQYGQGLCCAGNTYLMGDLGNGRILAIESCLDAVSA